MQPKQIKERGKLKMNKFNFGIQFADSEGTVFELYYRSFKEALNNVGYVKALNPLYINVRSLDGLTTVKVK